MAVAALGHARPARRPPSVPVWLSKAIARLIEPAIQPGASSCTSRKACDGLVVLVSLHVPEPLEVRGQRGIKHGGGDLVAEQAPEACP